MCRYVRALNETTYPACKMPLPERAPRVVGDDGIHDDVLRQAELLEDIIGAAAVVRQEVHEELVFYVLREQREEMGKAFGAGADELHAGVLQRWRSYGAGQKRRRLAHR